MTQRNLPQASLLAAVEAPEHSIGQKNYAGVRSLEKLYVILRQNARSNFYLEEERQSALAASGINYR